MIYLIWAMTKTGIIANNNQLPWNIKSEMQYFQAMTINKTVLMGSKTFLSIGKPLKNRYNIIITSEPSKYQEFASQNCIISNDLSEFIKKYRKNPKNELWIIGGAKIYQQTFEDADFLYISIIKENKQKFPGNLKFPIRDFSNFKEIKKTDYPEFIAYIYQRKV
ncbi:MAG: dihydrofolate reductase [Spiroplasma sp.]|nr:dihydrofolate reductase [Spiroplasma sp.]